MHGALPLLLLQACVILVAARLVGVLARRVGQPTVIAEVIAGILLGPSLFGRLAKGPFLELFPKASLPGLSLLSQFGLVFFMFLIGLELDPKLLRGRGKASFAISAAGIVVPFTLGALVATQIFAAQASPGVPMISFVLFMGIAMSITAFPVLARILAERNLIRTELGAVALACAAADDVTAWCLLAVVVSVVNAKGLGSAFVTTAFAVAFAGAMLLVVKPLLARLAARITTRENLTQNVVAFTFVLLLAAALLSEVIGIHALFGAFLFGAIMPRQGNYAHALAERLEDFVVVALLPLFFAFSGLRTELGLLSGWGDWLLCLALIGVACVGKFGGSFSVARLTGMSWRDSAALGVLMNTRGLMELIVLNIGLDLGVISPKIFTMMVIMALVTTIVTTPLLEWLSPRSFAAASPLGPESQPSAPARLLLCVGDSRMGPAMALLAAACGGTSKRAGSVALHMERPRDRTSGYLNAQGCGPSGLLPIAEAARSADVALELVSFDSVDPASDICELARKRSFDFVVLGIHRPLLSRNPFGGTVGGVLDGSPVPVAMLVDRGFATAFGPGGARREVLLALCGGLHDEAVLDFGERLLHDPAVALHIVQAHAALTERLATLRVAHRDRVELRALSEAPSLSSLILTEAPRAAVLLGLEATWGFDAEGPNAESLKLFSDSSTSLIVVSQKSA